MKRMGALLAVFVLTVGYGFAATAGQRAAEEASPGLESIFEPGLLIQDRNQDDVVDFVDVSFLLSDNPSASDVAAAADIAARLGFETMAMNLPVARGEDAAVTVVVGAEAVARLEAEPDVAELAPREGVVSVRQEDGRLWVLVGGRNDEATRHSARVLAGRLPYVWELDGPTINDVIGEVRDFLGEQGVTVNRARVSSVRVSPAVEGLQVLEVTAGVGSSAALRQARSALRELARSRRRPSRDANTPLSYPGIRTLRVRLSAPGARTEIVEVPTTARLTPGPRGARPGSVAKDSLDLSSLYTIEGLLGDSDENLIPDRMDALLSPFGGGTSGMVDLAARIGLESAGISIPVARTPDERIEPEEAPTLVLIGRDHPLVEPLAQAGTFTPANLEPGQGLIQVVPKAFGSKGAIVITGNDDAGLSRALSQVAERFPNVWARGDDRTTLDDVEQDLWDFLAARSPAGQAATALYKLDRLAASLADKDLASAKVSLYAEKVDDGLARWLRSEANSKLRADVIEAEVFDLDVQKAELVIEDTFDVPSEVEEFWRIFRERVVPRVRRGRAVTLEARLSEPPEVRERITKQALDELIGAGADPERSRVVVLSAYKQGYSWLYDAVRPALAGKSVHHLTIRFAEMGPPEEWPQQAMYAPTRWLLEMFPIDEVLAPKLGIGLDQISFEKTPIGSPAYEAIAVDAGGAEIFRGSFEPKFVLRSYFDLFPNYEKVRVTTGWITAKMDETTLADLRIVTEPERFWDHYQAETLPAIYDYVMKLYDGKPRREDAPHFGELRIELSLSEPDYQLGVDKEQISPMESIHEEIYFGTLHFFDVLGRYTSGSPFDYPGRILPIMRPRNDGQPGRCRITLTGFRSPRPAVVVTYRERNGTEGTARLDVARLRMDRPSALAAVVRDGREGIVRLDLRVKVDTEADRREELLRLAWQGERQVEEEILSAEQVSAVLQKLERLRGAGLYREALAYHDLGELRVTAHWDYDFAAERSMMAGLPPNGVPAPFPDIRRLLPDGYQPGKAPLVQWDTPIPPGEAYEILARMSTFPEAQVYQLGRSYLGKDNWAMDLMPPIEASHWSRAKATTLKPTVVYSARQHANEVSSTSHVLKFAEMLLTEPEFRQKLNKANVVIHPITNADGAQLAYDLHQITPNFMLHAGYLGSLGVDVLQDQWKEHPIYPESKLRPSLWRRWLPDIFLNPHGMPDHEWVQMFSEYAPWIRNRIQEPRSFFWMMRGWWMPGFEFLDDPKFPRHKRAAFELRQKIADYLRASPETMELNRGAYDRYHRYGVDFDPESFKVGYVDEVLLFTAIKGARADPQSADFMSRHPQVTIWTGSTEAPDETAHGDWLKRVAAAGLQWDKAILDYLVEGEHPVEREVRAFYQGTSLRLYRPRPPKTREAVVEGGASPRGQEPRHR